MAHNQNATLQTSNHKERIPYLGKPENQRDPRAPRIEPPRKLNKPSQQKLAHTGLNKPTKLHDTSKVQVSTRNPFDESVFSLGSSVNEVGNRTPFSPSTPALIEISRGIFSELITDDPSLNKVLLPEYLDYYSTAMIWFRFVSLKAKNSQPLTPQESDVLTLMQTQTFAAPEPLALQLRTIGNIETPNGQHLIPEFPPLPTEVISGFGGHYGRFLPSNPKRVERDKPTESMVIDPSLHLLYEEIPCLGVTAYAVAKTISNAPAGRYQSLVTYNDQQPTQNLLGYKPLGYRRPESKNFALQHGITENSFRSYPVDTGINIEFIIALSNILATTKTFKISHLVFTTLSELGHQSQIISTKPIVQPGQVCLLGELQPTSSVKEREAAFGMSVVYCSSMYKEHIEHDYSPWTLFQTIPIDWVENRNARRENLPVQYRQRVFSTASQHGTSFRLAILKSLVTVVR